MVAKPPGSDGRNCVLDDNPNGVTRPQFWVTAVFPLSVGRHCPAVVDAGVYAVLLAEPSLARR